MHIYTAYLCDKKKKKTSLFSKLLLQKKWNRNNKQCTPMGYEQYL